jgi:cytidine deaminase
MAEMLKRDATLKSNDALVERLCDAAQSVAKNAYSPYSGYRVGAAIQASGRVFLGTNVENVSYPATVCAERVAMGAVVSAGLRGTMTALALYAEADSEAFAGSMPLPCGICLQWLAELAPDIDIIVCKVDGVERFRVTDLLVRPFKKIS